MLCSNKLETGTFAWFPLECSDLKKRLALLGLLVFAISGVAVYMTFDLEAFRQLHSFRGSALVLALLCLAVGMFFDGTRLMHLVHIAGERVTLGQAVQVIFGNYFMAVLTPGAAGGAVAQVMFLRRSGVPLGKATVLVLVRTILSILFLLLCMPIVFAIDKTLIPWVSNESLMALSAVLFLGSLAGMWLVRTDWPQYVLLYFLRSAPHSRRRKVFALYRDVRGAVLILSSAPLSMLRVFAESALSLLFLYAMVPALFWGLGGQGDWLLIMGRMIFLNIILYFAPTPGGTGIAEGGFVLLFNEFAPPGTVGIVAVAWRILAEYLPFGIGFFLTVRTFGKDFMQKKLERQE